MNQQGAHKGPSFLASTLRVSHNQGIIQIYNNTKTLALAKNQNGFSE